MTKGRARAFRATRAMVGFTALIIIVVSTATIGCAEGVSVKKSTGVSPPVQCPLEAKEDYRVNPWYTGFSRGGKGAAVGGNAVPSMQAAQAQKKARPSGGSLKSEFILAVSDIVAERAEAELIQWFLDGMIEEFCGKEPKGTDALKYLFLNLCAMTQYDAAVMTSHKALISAFRKDLERMPTALLCRIGKEQGLVDRAYFTYSILAEIRKGAPAENMLAGLAENEKIKKGCKNNDESLCDLYFIGAVTRSYLEMKDQEVWIALKGSIINGLTDHQIKGLVEKHYTIKDPANFKWNNFLAGLKRNADDPEKIKRFLQTFSGITKKEAFDIFYDAFIEMASQRDDFKTALKDNKEKLRQLVFELSRIIDDIKQQVEVVKGVNASKDKAGILAALAASSRISRDVVVILKRSNDFLGVEIKSNGFKKTGGIEHMLNAASSVSSGNYSEALLDIGALLDEYEQPDNRGHSLLSPMRRYLPVITELASAETSEDIKEALNPVMSPIGAWKLKRERNMFSIGAFVGGQVSYEQVNDAGKKGKGFASGMFAPMGFGWTWAREDYCIFSKTCGFFASVMDLGNFVSARFSDTQDVESRSDVRFAQVFSPGLYLHWDFRKAPVAMGIGYSYAPKLRSLSDEDGEQQSVGRYMAFVAVDVTLFSF